MKILIVKISSLGDVIHGLAVYNAIRQNLPDAEIDWVVGDAYTSLVENATGIGKVFPFKRKTWGNSWSNPSTLLEIFRFITALRARKYDYCLDLQGLLRSGIITFLSGARQTIGFADAREGSAMMYGRTVSAGEKPHAVDKLLRFLPFLDLPIPDTADMRFEVSPESESAVEQKLSNAGIDGRYAVFHVGARWPTKQWPPGHWRTLAQNTVKGAGIPIVFTGGEGEKIDVERITQGNKNVVNMAGAFTLPELAALLKKAAFMVTVDSGPMHLSAAFGVPLIALFGATAPEKTGPYSSGPTLVLTAKESCSPCFKKACPKNLECMENIAPEAVEEQIRRLVLG